LLLLWGIYFWLRRKSSDFKAQSEATTTSPMNGLLQLFALYSTFVVGVLIGLSIFYLMLFNISPIPIYWLLYKFLPFFNKFRAPVVILIIVQMNVAILAGLGLQKLIDTLKETGKDEERKNSLLKDFRIVVYVIMGLMILAVPSLFYIFIQESSKPVSVEMFVTGWFLVTIFIVIGFGCFRMSLQNHPKPTWLMVGVVFLTMVDLWYVDYKLNNPQPAEAREAYLQSDITTDYLQADETTFRIYPIGPLFNDNRWAVHGIQSIGGYHPAKPRAYQDLMDASRLNSDFIVKYLQETDEPFKLTKERQMGLWLLDLLNVKYILSPVELNISNFSPCYDYQGPLYLYENKTCLPRAYLVGQYDVQTDPVATLTRLCSGLDENGEGFDPHRRVLLNEAPLFTPRRGQNYFADPFYFTPKPDSSASAQIQRYDFHHIAIETKSQFPQMLVLSDNYYPEPAGWQAYIDNQPVKTYRANYCFRAVAVPAGHHQVEFRFHSRAFTLGLWTSLVALVVGITLLFVERRRSP